LGSESHAFYGNACFEECFGYFFVRFEEAADFWVGYVYGEESDAGDVVVEEFEGFFVG
jgi:hypothetical protein